MRLVSAGQPGTRVTVVSWDLPSISPIWCYFALGGIFALKVPCLRQYIASAFFVQSRGDGSRAGGTVRRNSVEFFQRKRVPPNPGTNSQKTLWWSGRPGVWLKRRLKWFLYLTANCNLCLWILGICCFKRSCTNSHATLICCILFAPVTIIQSLWNTAFVIFLQNRLLTPDLRLFIHGH